MILEESGPGLRGRFGRANAYDVVLDGVLGDCEADLKEFTLDSFGSPQSILLGHLGLARWSRLRFWDGLHDYAI